MVRGGEGGKRGEGEMKGVRGMDETDEIDTQSVPEGSSGPHPIPSHLISSHPISSHLFSSLPIPLLFLHKMVHLMLQRAAVEVGDVG